MLFALAALAMSHQSPDWLTFEGGNGPGKGKHIVLLSGDEEYRSEEGLPQLAKILSKHHGFKCTVLFSIDDKGQIDPTRKDNEPGLEALDKADLCIMLLRFRCWPDDQMKHFVDYYLAGKPIIALRTSTHAFDYPADSKSPYAKFGWQSKEWPGGFGKQVLGETWVTHWGNHGSQATRGILIGDQIKHPVMRRVSTLFGTTDVYEAAPPPDATVLVLGQVLSGMGRDDAKAVGRKKTAAGVEQDLNEPMMPIVWTRDYKNETWRTNRIVTTTMGAATDLLDENLRHLLVNAAYWTTGLERKLSVVPNVDLVGEFIPSPFGFGGFRKGVRPADVGR